MLISTLILSLAPLLIWSQSAPPPPQSHSLSPYSRTPSPSQSPDSSCNDPNCSKSCIGGLPNAILCQSPTATPTQHHALYHVFNLNPAITSETQSSPSASGTFSGTTSPTTLSLQSLETVQSSKASKSIPTLFSQQSPISTPEQLYNTSRNLEMKNPGTKIGAGVGIGLGTGLGILILIALALAILWFRRRQNHQRQLTMDGLECEPKPSFEERSAKSPRDQSDATSSQDLSWLGDGRNISRETYTLPLCGPRLTALNTAIPRTDDFKSSSASKLIINSISSPGLLGDAHAAFRFLDLPDPMVVPATPANEARSPVSPEESPLSFFSSVPPSPEEILPSNTRKEPPPLATKKSHECFLPIPQQDLKATSTRSTSPSITPGLPQSITPALRPGGVRAHLRDHPQPLRSNSSASRKTMANPSNHREANIANNPPRTDSTAGGSAITVKDNLDAKNDSAAPIQNFSRKIGSLRSRQAQDDDDGPTAGGPYHNQR